MRKARDPKLPHPRVPMTGARCGCRPGIWRDNCPNCEGTGRAIDWRAYWRAKNQPKEAKP